MAELEHFAQDLHTLLTTGAPLVIKKSKQARSNVATFNRPRETKSEATKGVTA
jgi:hypothetical protein